MLDASLLPALHDALTVARLGSVARAAGALFKTPSAVSQQLRRIETIMHVGDAVPRVGGDTPIPAVVVEISGKRLGMTCVISPDGTLEGVVTDGDLRRHMTAKSNLLDRQAADVMTRQPVTIARQMLAVEALRLMEERKITSVVVVDAARRVEGVVHLHDLWRTQMI